MTCRFWNTYDMPEGLRKLSSNTRYTPFSSRIKSMPAKKYDYQWVLVHQAFL